MAGKNTAVYGIYANRGMAENAVDRLIAQGFRNEDISVMLQDNVGTKDFAHEKHTKAPEGTTTGAAAGATIGGTLGLLAGIGALAIPGLGPFIAAGPIMGALAGGFHRQPHDFRRKQHVVDDVAPVEQQRLIAPVPPVQLQ